MRHRPEFGDDEIVTIALDKFLRFHDEFMPKQILPAFYVAEGFACSSSVCVCVNVNLVASRCSFF